MANACERCREPAEQLRWRGHAKVCIDCVVRELEAAVLRAAVARADARAERYYTELESTEDALRKLQPKAAEQKGAET